MPKLQLRAIALLRSLISTPSLSGQEEKTAELIQKSLEAEGIPTHRSGNNVWVRSLHWEEGKPVILLNSHHDTVKANPGWQRDPFSPTLEGETLYGLGSNDAGGALVSLWAAFVHYYKKEKLPFNLIFAATAEEEISGPNGIASILDTLGPIDLGIIGEPTQMEVAIAEKGLMVIDCKAEGKAGHAARNEGINAIYKAMEDIRWFQSYSFEKVSPLLGPVKMSVTQIQAGSQHNVVPASCTFVVDVRTNEYYSNQEVAEVIRKHVSCEVKPRSYRLNSSGIEADHPVVQKALALGRKTYGSPTLSDQALIPYPTIKMGPGDSARSHTADEFILFSEIGEGIEIYIKLLEGLELV